MGSPGALPTLGHCNGPAKRKELRTQTGSVPLGSPLPLSSSVTVVESLNLFELSVLARLGVKVGPVHGS